MGSRIPLERALAYWLLKAMAMRFGRMYLKEMRLRLNFSMADFGNWLAVRAAERTAYGQPSELAGRAEFVRSCRAMCEKGIPPDEWYRKL